MDPLCGSGFARCPFWLVMSYSQIGMISGGRSPEPGVPQVLFRCSRGESTVLFKNILLRSVAGVTAVGSALALSLVAGPAMTTASPEIRNVGLPVRTRGRLHHHHAQARAPRGHLRCLHHGDCHGQRLDRRRRGRAGSECVHPQELRRLGPQDVDREAQRRQGHGHAAAPPPVEAHLRRPRKLPPEALLDLQAQPLGRGVLHRPQAGHAHGGERARTFTVASARGSTSRSAPPARSTPTVASGSSSSGTGKAIASQVHRLRSGRANATFRKFRPGHYDVKVRYLGARNFRGSSGEDGFRVYRH